MKKQIQKLSIVILLLAVGIVLIVILNLNQKQITNFEECAATGNPVGESYPRQCWTSDGKHFVEVIDDKWKIDSIQLRQHETEGFYGCFGCGKTLCIDPIFEMKVVEETEERYCSDEFEVIEK